MATSRPWTDYAMQIVGASGTSLGGQPLTGATVQLKKGTALYDGIEITDDVGNQSGIYSFSSVLSGNYSLWINGSSTGQVVSVGAGELENIGYDDDKIIISSGTLGKFLYKTYTEIKTLLGLNNVTNVALPDPTGQADGKVVVVESGIYVLRPYDLSVTASQVTLASFTGVSASDVQSGLEEVYSESARTSHTHDDRYFTETESDAKYLPNQCRYWRTFTASNVWGSFFGFEPGCNAIVRIFGAYDSRRAFDLHITYNSSNTPSITISDPEMLFCVRHTYDGSYGYIQILGVSGETTYFDLLNNQAGHLLILTDSVNHVNVTADESSGTIAESISPQLFGRIRTTGSSTGSTAISRQKKIVNKTTVDGRVYALPTGFSLYNGREVELTTQKQSQLYTTDGSTITLIGGTTTTSMTVTAEYHVHLVYDETANTWDVFKNARVN